MRDYDNGDTLLSSIDNLNIGTRLLVDYNIHTGKSCWDDDAYQLLSSRSAGRLLILDLLWAGLGVVQLRLALHRSARQRPSGHGRHQSSRLVVHVLELLRVLFRERREEPLPLQVLVEQHLIR